MALPVLSAGPVTIRHITQGSGAGAVTVLGATFIAQPRRPVNGRQGYSAGQYEAVLNDEGTATLTLPNGVGDDGVLHRRRFLALTLPGYRPGDEWLEIEHAGGAVFVCTPTDYDLTRSTLTLQLADALTLLNTQRETAAGFWTHAPRDVFTHYTKAWRAIVSDDFDAGADPARWSKAGTTDLAGSVLLSTGVGSPVARITAIDTYWGTIDPVGDRAWRVEMSYSGRTTSGGALSVQLALVNSSNSVRLAIERQLAHVEFTVLSDSETTQVALASASSGSLAIEVRDRFAYFYADGQLQRAIEYADSGHLVPKVSALPFSGTGLEVRIESLLLRRCDPFLQRGSDHGDLRLPGLLPAGGLIGTYFDEADLRNTYPDTGPELFRRLLAPTRQPYARRQDATINFPTSLPPTWQPAGPPNGEYYSVRWTGAIYLDLAAADVTLRLSQVGNAARLWVGKTMYGEQLLDSWAPGVVPTLTSGSLRTHTSGSLSGWYPVRIDYAQGTLDGGIAFEQSIGGGAYSVVPATALSPLGIYDAQVRYDSHAEQLKAVALAFGLQYRCDPKTLESGEFPGTVVPRARVGRDTDKTLTPAESTEASVKGSAGEVIDTLLVDAAGLADPDSGAQLTAESVNFAAITPGMHMVIASAYESLADITDPVLLQTRLASMLGLRVTPWQEISARPRGHRELRNRFPIPLTPDLAMFAWQPGDGLRVIDEALDLNDLTPRQIIAPTWPFVPDGMGAPSVRFRQRPRTQQDALRTLVRAVLAPQRNYQGQLVTVSGNVGASPATGLLTDTVSRVSLPADLSTIVSATLVIHFKSDTSVGTISVNGASTGITFSTVGRFDLRAFIATDSDRPRMYAGVSATTGDTEFALELITRI